MQLKSLIKIVVLSLSVVLASSCASIHEYLYKDKCASNNWQGLGEQDGQNGRSDFSDWTNRCQAFNSRPDRAQYDKGNLIGMQRFCSSDLGRSSGLVGGVHLENCKGKGSYGSGYTSGLAEFCSPRSAFRVGTEGKSFETQNCPVKDVSNLMSIYTKGKNLQVMKSKVAVLDGEVNEIQRKLYDPATPLETKNHYQSILMSKRDELKNNEREVMRIEESNRSLGL
jgi:hypothetical protein